LERTKEDIVRELKTYIVETSNVVYTLTVSAVGPSGPYRASYLGVPSTTPVRDDIDGEMEAPQLGVLLDACHKELADRGGKIIHVDDISEENILDDEH